MSPPPARRSGALAAAPDWVTGRGRTARQLAWLAAAVALWALSPAVIIGGLVLVGLAARTWRALSRARSERAGRTAVAAAGGSSIRLGVDAAGRPLTLAPAQLAAHGLILGASGSGKSTTLLSVLGQQIAAGAPVVAVDLKGSPQFAQELEAAAAAAGRPFRIWSLEGPSTWNPLAHGNPTELKDRLIATERFSEPHYQRAAERYVQVALGVAAQLRPGAPVELAEVVDLLEPRRLLTAARGLGPEPEARVGDYLQHLAPDQMSAVRGLASRLAVVSESTCGPWLAQRPDGIDLRAALGRPGVTLFSLNSSAYGGLAAQLGGLVIQDLVSAAGDRERQGVAAGAGPVTATVAIDEFSALGADHVMGLIARGRSAGLSVLLATQELADLDRVSPSFRRQVLGSTAVKIAHRQDVPESALEVARLAGSEPGWEESYSRTGTGRRAPVRVTARPVERWVVDPDRVQRLVRGEAVVITKTPRSETRVTQIAPLGLGRDRSDRDGRGPSR